MLQKHEGAKARNRQVRREQKANYELNIKKLFT